MKICVLGKGFNVIILMWDLSTHHRLYLQQHSLFQIAIVRFLGKRAPNPFAGKRRRVSKSGRRIHKKKTIIHDNSQDVTGSQFPGLTPSASGGTLDGANYVVHPTVVRANLPFKRRVNEVRRAATKAKRAAKSTLTRPHKKATGAKRIGEGATKRVGHPKRGEKAAKKPAKATEPVLSPTDSEQSGLVDTAATLGANGATTVHTTVTAAIPSTSAAVKSKQKESLSSRLSVISFKTFRPKSLNPDKYKITIIDKRKAKNAPKRSKSKTKKPADAKSRIPEKSKRDHEGKEGAERSRRNRSPSKRATMEDERHKGRQKMSSRSPDKAARRQTLPNGSDMSKYRLKSADKAPNEGNWLIQKFLADEERIGQSLAEGSLQGSVTSMNALINGSPVLSQMRHGSTRALLPDQSMGSPVRGIINEAFVSSPRGARTHSSLRVTKSVSPDEEDVLCSSPYRRSISMEAYNNSSHLLPVSPDKRKRSRKDEGASPDKKRRSCSPEKGPKSNGVPRFYQFGENVTATNSVSPLSSRAGSSHSNSDSSYSTSSDRGGKEKLSVVTATTGGSVVSIMEPTEILETASQHSSNKLMLETASLSSSGKGGLETSSLHSNSRDCPDSSSTHSKGVPETSSLHSSGKNLLETASQNSRETAEEKSQSKKTRKWV